MKKSKTTTILHGASWPYGSEKTCEKLCEKCDKTFRAFEEGAPVASVHSVLALAPDRMIEGALDDVQERQASRSPECARYMYASSHPGEQDLGTNLGTLTNKSHQEVLINSMMMRASIVATRVAIFNSLHAVIGR
jgi:hypothetical protein